MVTFTNNYIPLDNESWLSEIFIQQTVFDIIRFLAINIIMTPALE